MLDGYIEREQSVNLTGQSANVSANLTIGGGAAADTSAFAVLAALGIAAVGIVAARSRRR